MQAYLESIVCKFGGDPAICLREKAICAKVYKRTDGRTDDGRRAIALAHSWNELITFSGAVIKKIKDVYSSSWETHLIATGSHLPCEIIRCYLSPDTSECAPP